MIGLFALNALHSINGSLSSSDAKGASNPLKLERHMQMLETNLAKALMINEALWELMRDRLNITEDQLNEKLYQIDMRDGVLDGKNQRNQPLECPNCHRKISPKRNICIYCNQTVDDSVFRMV